MLPENSFNIVRLEYIFDLVSAFVKCSGGMHLLHSRESLFKWCNLVRLEYNFADILLSTPHPPPPQTP